MKVRFQTPPAQPGASHDVATPYGEGKRESKRWGFHALVLLFLSPLIAWAIKTSHNALFPTFPGRLALEWVELSAPQGGILLEQLAKEGDHLKVGQPIARLDDPVLAEQIRQSKKLQEALGAGDDIKQQLSTLKNMQGSYQALYREGAITRAEWDHYQQQLTDARRAWRMHRAEQAQAETNALQASQAQLTIKAPRSGQLRRWHAQVGEQAEKGGRLAQLLVGGERHVLMFVPPEQAARVRQGQRVTVIAPDGTRHPGRVDIGARWVTTVPGEERGMLRDSLRWIELPVQLESPMPSNWLIDRLPLQLLLHDVWLDVP